MSKSHIWGVLTLISASVAAAAPTLSEPVESRGVAAIWTGTPNGPVRNFQGSAFHIGEGWFVTSAHIFDNIPEPFHGNFHIVLAVKDGIQNSMVVRGRETCHDTLDICFFRVDPANAMIRDVNFAEPFEPLCVLPDDPELQLATFGFSGEVNSGLKRIEDGYGIQSRFADFVSETGRSYENALVTGAPTSPGMSGSPVVIDGTRQAIGVHTGFSNDTNNQIVTPFYNLAGAVQVSGQVVIDCSGRSEADSTPVIFDDELEALKIQIADIITDINKTLNTPGAELFPAFEAFFSQPSERSWGEVQRIAQRLHNQIQTGLEKIYEYNSRIIKSDTEVFLISERISRLTDHRYENPFPEVQTHWNGRQNITRQILVTKNIPTVDEAMQWRDDLVHLHQQLRGELMSLLHLLDEA